VCALSRIKDSVSTPWILGAFLFALAIRLAQFVLIACQKFDSK
jgi:hypothetical protein